MVSRSRELVPAQGPYELRELTAREAGEKRYDLKWRIPLHVANFAIADGEMCAENLEVDPKRCVRLASELPILSASSRGTYARHAL